MQSKRPPTEGVFVLSHKNSSLPLFLHKHRYCALDEQTDPQGVDSQVKAAVAQKGTAGEHHRRGGEHGKSQRGGEAKGDRGGERKAQARARSRARVSDGGGGCACRADEGRIKPNGDGPPGWAEAGERTDEGRTEAQVRLSEAGPRCPCPRCRGEWSLRASEPRRRSWCSGCPCRSASPRRMQLPQPPPPLGRTCGVRGS